MFYMHFVMFPFPIPLRSMKYFIGHSSQPWYDMGRDYTSLDQETDTLGVF